MDNWNKRSRLLRFLYQHLIVRFTKQISDPYLIRVDDIFTNPVNAELWVAFHIANKRVSKDMSVAKFVKKDMIFLVDPRVVFHMGQQFGAHTEKNLLLEKQNPSLRAKCITSLKRVFIDE